MPERVLKCPACGAPVTPPSRFARTTVCTFCNATVLLDPSVVSAARFREAHAEWNRPQAQGFSSWCTIDDSHWAIDRLLARGDTSDVYDGQRARWPTERVVLKILRDEAHADRFERQWSALVQLQASVPPGLADRLPQPVARGTVREGPGVGAHALVFRWASGFIHTLDEARRHWPNGIDPRAALWIWRRVLELLSILHRAGYAHRAVTPAHVLLQDGEHGARLVGFGEVLGGASTRDFERDLAASARTVASALGEGSRTPRELAALLDRVAAGDLDGRDAWALREHLGALSKQLFGPPSFNPLRFPT